MTEKLIDFDTAKLAKEKGFDYKLGICGFAYVDTGDIFNTLCIPLMFSGSEMFKAPTQSLLQKWLREKHDIQVWAKPVKPRWSGYVDNWGHHLVTEYLYGDTYESAIEKALVEALKLLK